MISIHRLSGITASLFDTVVGTDVDDAAGVTSGSTYRCVGFQPHSCIQTLATNTSFGLRKQKTSFRGGSSLEKRLVRGPRSASFTYVGKTGGIQTRYEKKEVAFLMNSVKILQTFGVVRSQSNSSNVTSACCYSDR